MLSWKSTLVNEEMGAGHEGLGKWSEMSPQLSKVKVRRCGLPSRVMFREIQAQDKGEL